MISEYNKQNDDRLTTDWSLEPLLATSGKARYPSRQKGKMVGYESKGEDALGARNRIGVHGHLPLAQWSI
jgi:hypothetical protein